MCQIIDFYSEGQPGLSSLITVAGCCKGKTKSEVNFSVELDRKVEVINQFRPRGFVIAYLGSMRRLKMELYFNPRESKASKVLELGV